MLLKRLLYKLGIVNSTLLTALIATTISVVITITGMLLFNLKHMNFAIAMSILCPVVIALPVTYFFLKLLIRIDQQQILLQASNKKLKMALLDVKELSGLLPICASCKKIRDDDGYWNQIESYIIKHTNADFSHGICPGCAKKLYPELNLDGLNF